jgi:uncharacterized small protein (DUF1192 family)
MAKDRNPDVLSDEELDKKREDLQALRDEIAQVNAERVQRDQQQSNAVVGAQLDAEAARLQAELAAAKATAKMTAPSEASNSPLEQAKTQMVNAEAARKAIEDAAKADAEAVKNQEN